MHYDLGEFEVRDVPKTDALQAQKEHSFSPMEEWWYSKLQDGEIYDGEGWPAEIARANLRESLVAYTRAYGIRMHSNATKLGGFLVQVMPKNWDRGSGKLRGTHTVIDESGETRQITRPNGYRLPSLEECRAAWEDLFGGKFQWQEAVGATADASLGLSEEAF